jgi:hypothetical protein
MSEQKTYTREVVQSISLGRDGKRINLTTGQVFEFNEDEYQQIMKSNPKAISAMVTVDLDAGDADPSKADGDSETDLSKAVAAKTGKKGGKKAASNDDL